jgi:hypothetical protein
MTAPNGLTAGASPLTVATKKDPHSFKKSYAYTLHVLVDDAFFAVYVDQVENTGRGYSNTIDRLSLGVLPMRKMRKLCAKDFDHFIFAVSENLSRPPLPDRLFIAFCIAKALREERLGAAVFAETGLVGVFSHAGRAFLH